jgi:hypothetical protein
MKPPSYLVRLRSWKSLREGISEAEKFIQLDEFLPQRDTLPSYITAD